MSGLGLLLNGFQVVRMVKLLGLLGCVDYIREVGRLGSEWQNTRCIILFVSSKLYEEDIMKKYLLGLGAMLIGAGLMFVFTHTEVSADNMEIKLKSNCQTYVGNYFYYEYCKIEDLTCVRFKDSVSCVKSG